MTTASQPLVSIVTPVYNEADYLAECIESILAQTYQNWDYTIVDNCSTDRTLEIARRYAAKDSRIRICENQHFLRPIPNHNVALRQISAASKYCKVVLGDDWIFPECLERMIAVAEAHPTVGIVGAYVLEGERVICSGLPYSTRWISGREVCRKHFLENLYVFGSATSLLFRADRIRCHDPFYNEANIHADTEACFQVLKTSDFGFVHQVLTYTRVRPMSLTAKSADFHTDYPGMLRLLLTQGPAYLTPEEFSACLERHMSAYYGFLGMSWLRRRKDAAFWDYHERKMIEAGMRFSRSRLVLGILEKLAGSVLNPKQAIEKLWKHRDAHWYMRADRPRLPLLDGKETR